ncbi:acetyltransferase [Coemansia sp. RSA 2322]|uniref:Acetyltransferase n=1 Tax=Coemansia thaxteri TaxID=2663907 RepID=A0A9W8BGT4_9FUNG|nr:acetyltransferase [Coemansia thaxteri]KAJ2472528.1 acetyltransferase [Coemansia sp. RSA 2322]KAJ2477697.1 acetyltransferase [Coemansia sp. RSA 2320]
MSAFPSIRLAPATEDDVGLVLSFIQQLAAYERATPDQVPATEALLRQNLFGPRPYAKVMIAYVTTSVECEEKPAGFAVYFYNFSTWTARPGLYLEDLFVSPDYRGLGVGKLLLVQLAKLAKDRQCGRMEWVVLDWNKPAIDMYLSLGAEQLTEWIINRVSGPSLDHLAGL